jgi:large subunit ribosomal protein L22
MEVTAIAKYVKRTPSKARLVADAVKGMRVDEALTFLQFSPKHAAYDVAKVIKSAAANAEHNFNLDRDTLVVARLLIDEGPTMKRGRPRSRGMFARYFKRTCHITAVVEDRAEPRRAARRTQAATAGARSTAPARPARRRTTKKAEQASEENE